MYTYARAPMHVLRQMIRLRHWPFRKAYNNLRQFNYLTSLYVPHCLFCAGLQCSLKHGKHSCMSDLRGECVAELEQLEAGRVLDGSGGRADDGVHGRPSHSQQVRQPRLYVALQRVRSMGGG